MRILGIDPGTEKSGFVVWDDGLIESGELNNSELLVRIVQNEFGKVEVCGIEMVASYGMAVGREVFETVFWIGRIYERAIKRWTTIRVYRKDVKMFLCGTSKAKDSNISQALRDKHGEKGTKKAPGKLYGISKHTWAALAVADYIEGLPKELSF